MALRFLLLGMNGAMTQAVLQGLLAGGHRPVAIMLPAQDPDSAPYPLPATSPPDDEIVFELLEVTTTLIAWQNEIPVWLTGALTTDIARRWLETEALDLIIVACFPWRIPEAWLNWPAAGVFNVHPSQLPAYRGPTPLFWQLRDGATTTGVTIHHMISRLDAGPIVAQQSWPWQTGWREEQANFLAGKKGGELLSELLDRPVSEWPRRAQDETKATYQAIPSAADLQILTQWSAQQAYNFVRGSAGWKGHWLVSGREQFLVDRAIAWEANVTQAEPFIWIGKSLRVSFARGTVDFVLM